MIALDLTPGEAADALQPLIALQDAILLSLETRAQCLRMALLPGVGPEDELAQTAERMDEAAELHRARRAALQLAIAGFERAQIDRIVG